MITGLQGHRSGIISVDFHPTRLTSIVSLSEDGTIKTWEVDFPKFRKVPFSFRCIATTRTHKAQQVSYSPGGECITSCGDQDSDNPENHTFRMCSAQVTSAPSHTAKVDSLFVSPDGSTIASRSKDQIMLWSRQGEFQACLVEPLALNDICAAAFSTGGGLIAGGGVKGRIVIWEIPSTATADNDSTVIRLLGETVSYEHRGHLCLTPTKLFRYTKEYQTHIHSQEITALTFCPSMPWLASAANDGKVIIWDTDRENPLWCMEHTRELIDVDVVSLTFLTATALLLGIAWPSCGMRVSPRLWTVCKRLWQLENRETDGIWVPICKNNQGNIHEEDARELHKMSLTGPPLMSNESIMPYKWHCDDQESLLSAREQSDSVPLAFFKHSRPITAVLQGNNQAMVFGDVEGGVFFVVGHSKKTEDVDRIQLWVELYEEPWTVILHLSKTSTLSSLHHIIYDKGGIPITAQSAHYLCLKKGSHSQTLPRSSEILATCGIKEGDTIKVFCRLLGGGGQQQTEQGWEAFHLCISGYVPGGRRLPCPATPSKTGT
jgi:WD40 repeat protein